MARQVPGPWVRRPVGITTLILLALLLPLLAPIALLVTLILDLLNGGRPFRRTRAYVLIAGLVAVDLAGLVMVGGVWLISPLGWDLKKERTQKQFGWVMTAWTTSLIRVIAAVMPLTMHIDELDPDVLKGNAIVIGRHRSLLDAVLPAVIFGNLGLTALYTLKEDLRREPNIDLVGHWMGHRFVTRAPQNLETELEPIRALGGRLEDSNVAVIFPEGTFFTAERKAKIIRSIEEKDPGHAEQARALNHLLPPRPGGTLALLDGAPDADIIVFGHSGFELYGSIPQILKNIGTGNEVHFCAWRIPRETVPLDREEQIEWLFDVWAELDAWIDTKHPL
ncbi:MAG: 1-acyl-sn-glycerol-3-phosphate acyltransferase [Acidimicrobiales bacterium]